MASCEGDRVTEIDGSVMEGGGQILRNAVTLSCLLQKPLSVKNIRVGRSNPGLRPQHLQGLRLCEEISNGKLKGGTEGSTAVTIYPQTILAGNFLADTKTAGSVGLLMQISLPCLFFAPSPCKLVLKGGTNAEMAPQIDHTIEVFKPVVERFGVKFECDIKKRGYFPKGGGEVHVQSQPVNVLKPINLTNFGSLIRITGRAFVAGVLPIRVAQCMAQEATRYLRQKYSHVPISVEAVQEPKSKAFGNGTGLLLVAESSTGCKLGASSLGKRGVPAEEIAAAAAKELTEDLETGSCVDRHLQDQLILFMALAQGRSRLRTGPLTLHTQTAMHTAEQLAKVKFQVNKATDTDLENYIIECEGIGLENKSL